MTEQTNEHIADRAGFLAALPSTDVERRQADEHAAACAPCREALAEGGRLCALLQRALAQPPVATPLGTQPPASAAATAVQRRMRRADTRRMIAATTGAAALAWAFQLMVGGGLSISLASVAASLAVLAIAVASVTLLRGTPRAVAIIVLTSAAFAYLAGTEPGIEAGIGVRCMLRELWAAAIAWVIVVIVARRSGVALGRWSLTAIAAGGALAAHAGQHLACRVPHAAPHVYIFHTGGVLLAAVIGAALARRRPFALAAR